jgi:hypothetical protein
MLKGSVEVTAALFAETCYDIVAVRTAASRVVARGAALGRDVITGKKILLAKHRNNSNFYVNVPTAMYWLKGL